MTAILPMLCHAKARQNLDGLPTEGYVMEPKLDGWRWIVKTGPAHPWHFGGRNGAEWTGSCPAIDAALSDLPPGTILDGELLPLDGQTSVRTLLAQKSGMCLAVFDVLAVGGHDCRDKPWHERRELLDHMALMYFDGRLVRPSIVSEVDPDQLSAWLDLGLEGAVVKSVNGTYRKDGGRSHDWIKVKPQSTTDAIVMGWGHGEGQSNSARVGKLIIRLVDTGVTTSCAYDCWPAEVEALIGRRIEIKHHGWFPSGAVRHPIFLRIREDLEAAS